MDSAGQEFITDLLELGLRTRRSEQALAQYARGQMTLGAAAHQAVVWFFDEFFTKRRSGNYGQSRGTTNG